MIIEERVRRRARRKKIQNIVLGSLYVVGVLGMVAIAPNSSQLLKHAGRLVGHRPNLNRRIGQAITRL